MFCISVHIRSCGCCVVGFEKESAALLLRKRVEWWRRVCIVVWVVEVAIVGGD